MSLYFVVLTGSVSNILTIFVVSSLFLIKLFQGKKRIIAILVLCFSVALFFALINVPSFSYYKTRLIDMFLSFLSDGQAGDPSATSRFQGALNGFYLFIERPLFGNGYSATLSNYYIMSHNNFSEVSANYGIFGLIFQEALLLLPIFSIAQKRDPLSIVFFSIALFLFSFQVFLTCFDAKIDYCLMPFVYAHIFQIGPSSLKKSKAIARFSFSVYR
jgi:O-antigen ligase